MRRLLVLGAAIAMALTACGGNGASGDLKSTLVDAFGSLSNSAHTLTFSLDSDAASLQAASEGNLSAADASKILASSLAIEGNNETDPNKAQARITFSIGGKDDAEIRTVNQVIYIRADVADLLSTFGQDPAAAAKAARQAGARGLTFVQDIVDGKWVALQGFAQLQQQLGGQTPGPEALQGLRDSLTNALKSGITSVSKQGSDSVGDHYVATVSLRKTYDAIIQSVQSLLPQAAQGNLPASGVPDKDVKLDVWVKSGDVTQLEFDFLQLGDITGAQAPQGVDKLALKLTIAPFSGTIAAPTGAVPVDLTKIFQSLLGGLGGSSGSSSGSSNAAFCTALKQRPKSIQQQFAQQCPNL